MQVLSHPDTPNVAGIFHIADLHVRNGDSVQSRNIEYSIIFSKLIDEISNHPTLKNGTAILVIAGDVFHNKGRFETTGAHLMFTWLNQLLNILPVFIICGNHDFRQDDPTITDSIEMLLSPYEFTSTKYTLHYLKHTGHYIWKNIGFGLCSIKDTLRKHNTFGSVDILPQFPDPSQFPLNLTKVALFHGTVAYSHQFASNCYPLSWFHGYDIAILGDNHKQQLHIEGDLKWGYPGSLVQQDIGEPFEGHGYILWDIKSMTATCHHIKNDFGSVTIIKKDQQYLVKTSTREFKPLLEVIKTLDFPRSPRLRVIASTDDDLKKTLTQYGIQPYSIKFVSTVGSSFKTTPSVVRMNDVNSPEQWHQYIQKINPNINVSNFICQPSTLLLEATIPLPPMILEKIRTRNVSIQKCIDDYDASVQSINQRYNNISFKHMEWSYLMCFGENNYFDFTAIEGSIALLNAGNAIGKSSFLDIICICLYGVPTSSRVENNEIKVLTDIVHDDKPSSASANVKLDVTINDKLFEIKRSCGERASGVKRIISTTVSEIKGNETHLVAEGSTMVNSWVQQHFGTIHELLMSSIICQLDNTSFFFKNSAEQKLVIDNSLNLNTISTYQCILDESIKAYKSVINDLTTYIVGKGDSVDEINTDDLTETLAQLKAEESTKTTQLSLLTQTLQELHLKIGVISPEISHDFENSCLEEALERTKSSKSHDSDQILVERGKLEQKRTHLLEQGYIPSQIVRDTVTIQQEIDNLQQADLKSIEYELQTHLQNSPPISRSRDSINADIILLKSDPPCDPAILKDELMKVESEYDRLMATPKPIPSLPKPDDNPCIFADSKTLTTLENALTLFNTVDVLSTVPHNKRCNTCKANQTRLSELKSQLQNSPKYQENQIQWAIYEKWSTEVTAIKATRSELRHKLDCIEKATVQYNQYMDVLEERSCCDAYSDWQSTLHELQTRKSLVWTMTQQLDSLSKELSISQMHSQWQELQSDLDKLSNLEYSDNWQKVAFMHQACELQHSIDELKTHLKQITIDTTRTTHMLSSQTRSSQKSDSYNKELLKLTKALETISTLRDVFIGSKTHDGFKASLYRDRVLPLLESEVNMFLENIDNIKLKITLHTGKLVYRVEDRGNVVLMGNCSGYQRFIIGLAMRAALCRIGAVGQSVKHLMIDEGFGCCDSTNIQNANNILQALMHSGKYESMIIMSHLDTIRDASQKIINIHRDGRFSYIKYGSPSQKRTKGDSNVIVEKKAKGRPRKF